MPTNCSAMENYKLFYKNEKFRSNQLMAIVTPYELASGNSIDYFNECRKLTECRKISRLESQTTKRQKEKICSICELIGFNLTVITFDV